MLDLAVLGLLADGPLHGYELRKRLGAVLGPLRAFSFGSLYPCLRRLESAGHVARTGPDEPTALGRSRRARVVYRITAEGKERFHAELAEAGPASWDDGSFDVHLAFFGSTPAEARLRVLEGRRRRLEERREAARQASARRRERADRWSSELQRHGLETVERDVRWLDELIAAERSAPAAAPVETGEPDAGDLPAGAT